MVAMRPKYLKFIWVEREWYPPRVWMDVKPCYPPLLNTLSSGLSRAIGHTR